MRSDPETIVESFYRAWLQRDIETALVYIDEAVRASQHFEDPGLPFAGTTTGKAAFAGRLQAIAAAWKFDEAVPTYTYVDDEVLRAHCRFVIRHLETGEVFEGVFRHIWVVRDGRIVEVDEYIDIARLRSFLRLLGIPTPAA